MCICSRELREIGAYDTSLRSGQDWGSLTRPFSSHITSQAVREVLVRYQAHDGPSYYQ